MRATCHRPLAGRSSNKIINAPLRHLFLMADGRFSRLAHVDLRSVILVIVLLAVLLVVVPAVIVFVFSAIQNLLQRRRGRAGAEN